MPRSKVEQFAATRQRSPFLPSPMDADTSRDGGGAQGSAARRFGSAAPCLRFHDLRHSYASWQVSDGVPINVVSRLMAHEQISTTLNRCTHDAGDYADGRVRQVFAALAADDLLTSGEP